MINQNRVVAVHRNGRIIQRRYKICANVPNIGGIISECSQHIFDMLMSKLQQSALNHVCRYFIAVYAGSAFCLTHHIKHYLNQLVHPHFVLGKAVVLDIFTNNIAVIAAFVGRKKDLRISRHIRPVGYD